MTGLNSVLTKLSSTGGKEIRLITCWKLSYCFPPTPLWLTECLRIIFLGGQNFKTTHYAIICGMESTENDNKEPQELLAAIDLGSNSFHMIVAQDDNGTLKIIDRVREMVRLGGGLEKDGTIAPKTQQRALEALQRLGQRLQSIPTHSVRAVGTKALRSSKISTNKSSADFLQQANKALGHEIEIISGQEEARLVYMGVANSIASDKRKRLVIDIGGGSTEFIIGQKSQPEQLDSLNFGCVSISQQFFTEGTITVGMFEQAELSVMSEVRSIKRRVKDNNWELAIGSSGTIRAIAKVSQNSGWSKHTITKPALQKLRKKIIAAGRFDKLELDGLKDARKPVFPGGVAILCAIFNSLDIQEMHASEGALREGLLQDLRGRISHKDIRNNSIQTLLERHHIDKQQAQNVANTAMELFDQTAHTWGFAEKRYRDLLNWSALLYEIGLTITHSKYHRHGAYLIEYSDIAGFSQQDSKMLATLVLNHRRKFNLDSFAQFNKKLATPLIRLAVLLRLAVLFQRGRSGANPSFALAVAEQQITIRMQSGWLDQHPLTESDLAQERVALLKAGFQLDYQ